MFLPSIPKITAHGTAMMKLYFSAQGRVTDIVFSLLTSQRQKVTIFSFHYFTDFKAHKESHCISKVVTCSVLSYIFCNLVLLNGGGFLVRLMNKTSFFFAI